MEGDIEVRNEDTILAGMIRFIDKKTGRLQNESNYSGGILNGPSYEFYSNGRLRSRAYYQQGKLNGTVVVYDSLGTIKDSSFRYYDLKAGPAIKYSGGKMTSYSFSDLTSEELISIDLSDRDWVDSFVYKVPIFYHARAIEGVQPNRDDYEGFIFFPSPPGLQVEYQLVRSRLSSPASEVTVVKQFRTNSIFDTFAYSHTDNDSLSFQLVMKIYDQGKTLLAEKRKRL